MQDERTVELEATFSVFPEEDAPSVILLNRRDLTEELRQCVQPVHFSYHRTGPNRLDGVIQVIAPPVDVAFDVLIAVDDEEHNIGSIHRERGEMAQLHVGTEIAYWSHQTCTVILRSSADVARQTVDLFEIWDGELRYDDVPVKVHTDQR